MEREEMNSAQKAAVVGLENKDFASFLRKRRQQFTGPRFENELAWLEKNNPAGAAHLNRIARHFMRVNEELDRASNARQN